VSAPRTASSTCLPSRAHSRVCAVALLVVALAILASPLNIASAVTVEGRQFIFRGQPLFIRGAMYYQPHAYHQYFWETWWRSEFLHDLDRLPTYGFNAVALQVNWGSFASRVDPLTGETEWRDRAFRDLRFALRRLGQRGLLAILWTGTARLPDGVAGAHNPTFTDLGGRTYQPYDGYLIRDWPAIAANDSPVWRAMLDFHRKVAEACADADNVLYDPLDWQHLNINPWSFADPGNLAAWRDWLRSRTSTSLSVVSPSNHNPDLQYWNQRWGETNATWDEVLLPVDEWVENATALLGPPYRGRPRDPYEGPKWADFRDWHDALCNTVNAQIVAAIRAGDPDALIGQRVDIWHFGDFRQRTWAPQGVAFFCQGTYPETPQQVSPDEARKTIRLVTDRAPRQLPILFWETGLLPTAAPPADLPALQAQWLNSVESVAHQDGLLGFCWWVWRDYYMNDTSLSLGLLDLSGDPKPALTGAPPRH